MSLISLLVFVIVMGLYEFAIRRNNLLRLLFGMKPKPATEKRTALDGALTHHG